METSSLQFKTGLFDSSHEGNQTVGLLKNGRNPTDRLKAPLLIVQAIILAPWPPSNFMSNDNLAEIQPDSKISLGQPI